MKKRILALALAAAMVMALVPMVSFAATSTDAPVGIDLMAMNTRDLEGNTVNGELFTNGSCYTILSVWATWARPATNTLVHLNKVYNDTIGLNVVGVLFEDQSSDVSNAQHIADSMQLDIPTVRMDSVLCELFNATFDSPYSAVLPVHYLVDHKGTVIDAKIGSFEDEFEVLDWLLYHCNQTPPYIQNPDLSEHIAGMDLSGMNTTDIEGNAANGEVFAENSFTVLNVWASWCSPSLLDMAALEELNNSDLGVKVMGVLVEDEMSSIESAGRIVENKGLTYRNLRFDGVLQELLDATNKLVPAIPVTYLVNSEGIVVAARVSAFGDAKLMESWLRYYMDAQADVDTDVDADVDTEVDTEVDADVDTEVDTEVGSDVEVAPVPSELKGDLNGNLKVEAADATLALRCVIGNIMLSELQSGLGDMNGNGRIDSADATLILRLAVG